MSERCPACNRPFLNLADPNGLTPKEVETIKELIANPASNRIISDRMGTIEQVVKNRLHHAYKKLGVHSRVELLVLMSQA